MTSSTPPKSSPSDLGSQQLSGSTDVRLRSGAAARMAGIPVSTLRVWERRYAVVAAPKTDTGQRLYGTRDVQRLRLIKQLTLRGHAIGTLASLDLPALDELAHPPAAPAAAVAPARLTVVGRAMAHKLTPRAAAWGLQAPLQVHDTLEQALGVNQPGERSELAVLGLASLQQSHVDALSQWAAQGGPSAVIVVYGFGAANVVDAVRATGALVRREPLSTRELLMLVEQALTRVRPLPALDPSVTSASFERRFSDERLAELCEWPTEVACECPRHLAEIVLQLAHFERYSADCLSRNPDDAALHRSLSALTAQARARFEDALQRVAILEGAPGADRDGASRS